MAEDTLELLTVEEVAREWKVRPGRIYELAREGRLPGVVRLGRQVRLDATRLRDWIAAGGQALPGGWRRRPER